MIKETHPTPKEPEHIKCEVCKKEIPESAGETVEGDDYVHHFCGLECLDEWHSTRKKPD